MNRLSFWSEGENYRKEVIKTEKYYIYYKDQVIPHVDITSGWGAFTLGYNNREIIDKIYENYNVAFLRANSSETCLQEEQLEKIILEKGNWTSLSWAVSGSDAVEAAMAMADNYYEISEGEHRKKVIVFYPCFVGTTMWGKHVRRKYDYMNRVIRIDSPKWETYDQQLIEEEKTLNHLRQILESDQNKEIGSLLMESSPWLDDMIPWSKNFWQEIRKICDNHNILWILDDVAVCWGKFGTWYGWQQFNVQPDISSIGKALTGGLSPLGAAVCNKKVYDILSQRSWDHGHTWHPNMHGVVAAIETTKYIENNKLLDNCSNINLKLKNLANYFGCVSRGDNMFICIDVNEYITPEDLWKAGLATGLPSQSFTAKGQIKIAAPLIADEDFFKILKDRLEILFKNKKIL
jgi:adenosylmethionine-8-amino-7-oxononanoate aminotransferase